MFVAEVPYFDSGFILRDCLAAHLAGGMAGLQSWKGHQLAGLPVRRPRPRTGKLLRPKTAAGRQRLQLARRERKNWRPEQA